MLFDVVVVRCEMLLYVLFSVMCCLSVCLLNVVKCCGNMLLYVVKMYRPWVSLKAPFRWSSTSFMSLMMGSTSSTKSTLAFWWAAKLFA